MKDRIVITESDLHKLRELVESRRSGLSQDREHLDSLEAELDRADVVQPGSVPREVITMNSRVRLRDCDSGAIMVYRLVFPTQARSADSISILAPVGTALLGYRVGDVIEWRVPKGIRRLEVLDVLYQPEAAGTLDNELPAA